MKIGVSESFLATVGLFSCCFCCCCFNIFNSYIPYLQVASCCSCFYFRCHVFPLSFYPSVEIYVRMSTDLLPTPAKSHYVFNLRDLSKCIQGKETESATVVFYSFV